MIGSFQSSAMSEHQVKHYYQPLCNSDVLDGILVKPIFSESFMLLHAVRTTRLHDRIITIRKTSELMASIMNIASKIAEDLRTNTNLNTDRITAPPSTSELIVLNQYLDPLTQYESCVLSEIVCQYQTAMQKAHHNHMEVTSCRNTSEKVIQWKQNCTSTRYVALDSAKESINAEEISKLPDIGESLQHKYHWSP